MKTKNIIQRNLPLNVKYHLIDKKYISLLDGGCSCDNCGKSIANIATIKNDNNQTFYIGFDCLETIIINNNLFSENDIKDVQHFRKFINSYINAVKKIKYDFMDYNPHLKFEALKFEVNNFINDVNYWNGKVDKKGKIISSKQYFTFYYIFNNDKKYNSNIKMSNDINVTDFLNVVNSILKLKIITI